MEIKQFRRAFVLSPSQRSPGWVRSAVLDADTLSSALKTAHGPSLYVALYIVLLSAVLYSPFLTLPFLSDDYLQITLGRKFGPSSEWRYLFQDPLYRNRATSLILTYWTDVLFPFSRFAFGISSILLHAMNAWLVYGLGTARSIGWRLSAVTALVFVLQERHHEAVIWYAALPELLVFTFGLSTILLWIQWFHSLHHSRLIWLGALMCFLLALFSKESAVAVVILMALAAAAEGIPWRRAVSGLLPFAVLAAGYVVLAFLGRDQNHHFSDGTFTLQFGVFKTMLLSAGRGLWVWGWGGLIALALLRAHKRSLLLLALGWSLAALLPYSFLDYMTAVPSRHHYLASVGYSLILASGILALRDRTGMHRLLVASVLIIGLHHAAYLWTSKLQQFRERSEPIEALIHFMQQEPRRPVVIRCSDYYFSEAQRAAYLRLGEPLDHLILDFTGGTGEHPTYCLPGML